MRYGTIASNPPEGAILPSGRFPTQLLDPCAAAGRPRLGRSVSVRG
jgi:hypothetical protein